MASRSNVEAPRANKFHFVIVAKLRSMAGKYKINDLLTDAPLPDQQDISEGEKDITEVAQLDH